MAGPVTEGGQKPLSGEDKLRAFVAGLTPEDAARFREGTVYAEATWQVRTKRLLRKPTYHTETRVVPVDVLYTRRFSWHPQSAVYRQHVSYDEGLTERISERTVFPATYKSKKRLERVVAGIPIPTVEELKTGRHGWEDVPGTAKVRLRYDSADTKKVTVVKLKPDPSAPGDEDHDSNVRVIVDTRANPLRPRRARDAKVVVLDNTQSDEYLGTGTATEEAHVRTTHHRFATWHRGAIRARTFVDRMVSGKASHTLAAEHKPESRDQETHPDTAPFTVALTNTKKEE